MSSGPGALFPGGVRALNVGVAEFSVAPRAHGAAVVPLDWRPPAGGDRELGLVLARLEDDLDDPVGARVAAANRLAVERLLAARPVLVDVRPAASWCRDSARAPSCTRDRPSSGRACAGPCAGR